MSALLKRITELKAHLADHPDVMPDERVRIEAVAWIVRTVSLATTLLAVPLAIVGAGALMFWIDGGRDAAAACGMLSAVGVVGGIAALRTLGLTLERAYLERVVGRAGARELERLASANASHSSVAVPALVEVARR
jgi:hypothetical protein